MNIKDKLICASYILIAFVALLATWINNLAFMTQSSNASFADFFRAAYVNAAAASLTNDLILVAFVACIFMAIEGRRIGIRYFWLYIIMSAIIAGEHPESEKTFKLLEPHSNSHSAEKEWH